MPAAYLTRRVVFSASHRLHSETMTEQENQSIFGKCNLKNGHGHNYTAEITLKGPISSKTGMVFSLTDFKKIISETIEKELDHKNLNLDVPAFQKANPTVENIALFIWKLLQPKFPIGLLNEVKVYETENNISIYKGE